MSNKGCAFLVIYYFPCDETTVFEAFFMARDGEVYIITINGHAQSARRTVMFTLLSYVITTVNCGIFAQDNKIYIAFYCM